MIRLDLIYYFYPVVSLAIDMRARLPRLYLPGQPLPKKTSPFSKTGNNSKLISGSRCYSMTFPILRQV